MSSSSPAPPRLQRRCVRLETTSSEPEKQKTSLKPLLFACSETISDQGFSPKTGHPPLESRATNLFTFRGVYSLEMFMNTIVHAVAWPDCDTSHCFCQFVGNLELLRTCRAMHAEIDPLLWATTLLSYCGVYSFEIFMNLLMSGWYPSIHSRPTCSQEDQRGLERL